MICLIYSTSKKIPPDPWSQIKSYNKKSDVEEYTIDSLTNILENTTLDDSQIIRNGYGFFAKFGKKTHVVTCFHIIGQANIEVTAFAFDKNKNLIKMNLFPMVAIPEFDLIVLDFDSEKYNIECVSDPMNISAIETDLKKCKLMYCDTIKVSDIPIKDVEIRIDYFKSSIIPKIPLIKYTCDLEKINMINMNDDIDGLSGTLIKIDSKIVGMTTSYSNRKMEALPLILIYSILKELIVDNTKKLAGFYFSSNIINIENGENMTCHYVSNPSDVLYPTDTKNFRFKYEDIITEVNGTKFNDDGTIYNDIIGYNLALDTHMMILNYVNSTTKIKILRKKNEKYYKISKNIKGVPFNDVYPVNIENDHRYFYWRGFIFTELSEELIFSLNCAGYSLKGGTFDKYKIIKNDTKKIVVLIDVDHKIIDAELSEQLKIIGAPLIRGNDGYKLLILEKIGNKKINRLKDLETLLLTSDSEKSFSYRYQFEDNDYKLII